MQFMGIFNGIPNSQNIDTTTLRLNAPLKGISAFHNFGYETLFDE